MNSKLPLSSLLTAVACSISSATPVVEECFDYDEGPVTGLDGGTGFSSGWSNPRNNPVVVAPGLTWGELLTSGNSSRGNAWSSLVRPLDTAIEDAGLLENGSSLWFSIILDLEGQNIANADLNLSLGTAGFVPSVFGDRENLASGEGIGVTHSRARIQGVYWQDSDNDTVAERVENNSTLLIDGGDGRLTRALVVGRIDWGADENADETLTLYAPGEDLALGEPIMDPWILPALDQSAFNQIALQYKDTPQMDEVRLGATSTDVLPKVGGPVASPVITSLTAIDPTTYELTIVAAASSTFSLTSSETLDFQGSELVTGLTQGSPEDAGSIDNNGLAFTTDEEGNATIRFTSVAAKNFVWIGPPIVVGP